MSTSEKPQTQFTQVVRRWWWLLVLAPLLAGAVSFYLTKDEPSLYEAESQLMIGPSMDTPNPDLNSLRTSGALAQTYKKLAATDTFLQAVIGDLKIPVSIKVLKDMIDLTTDPNSLILTIDVQSRDPQLAIKIANAVAKELLNMSPANPNSPAAVMQVQNRAQVNALEESIKQTELKISSLESNLQNLDQQTFTVNDPQYQILDATENWVKYLESEYEKLTSVAAQSQMGNQILNELIKNSLLRINNLESDLHKTDLELQHLVLAQIDAENNHLSTLQNTLQEMQQYIEGKPLDEYIQSIQANIADLSAKYTTIASYDITNRRFVSDQIAAERIRLTNAEKMADDRRLQVFLRLSDERSRLSTMKALPVTEMLEKRQLISDQITTENGRLTTMQNSRATLANTLLQSWTNQVQITQLASSTTKVPSNFQLIVLSACIAGLAAAMAFVLTIEYFDNSDHSVRDLGSIYDIPLLGNIQTTRSINSSQLLFANQSAGKTLLPASILDDYRLMVVKMLLRLNSGSSEDDNIKIIKRLRGKRTTVGDIAPSRTILICGLNSEDNTSEIAANIAMVLAQTGNSVLLVDPTLREPANAKIFGTDTVGSSIILTPGDSPVELLSIPEVKNLSILPISPILTDPFGLYAPTQTPGVISDLKNYASFILIVGSNLMASSETFGLASRVDGLILVTPEAGLNREQVDSLMKDATTYKWEIIGTVLVKIRTGLQPFRNNPLARIFRKFGKTINTMFVKTRNGLQSLLKIKLPFLFGKLGKTLSTVIVKIRTSLQYFRKQQLPFLFGKFGKIPEKNSAIPGNEAAFKETNDIEDQSL